ncbi:MAG: enolase C-terminal domain-like protein [Candidatus Latescibacterota bacterium]|nr:enolase C-terminal domain-like protein [Candidatus Latescibacterota bacterium]
MSNLPRAGVSGAVPTSYAGLRNPLYQRPRGPHQLRKAVPWMPIATGEDHHTRIPFRQLVENRSVDVVQPDLHWCGGITEAAKIYHIAEAAGIKCSPHEGLNSAYGQHFCYAFPNALSASST